MHHAYYLALLVAVLMVCGCKKETHQDPVRTPADPHGPGTQMLVAGDTTNMMVIHHDAVLTANGLGSAGYLNVDVNGAPSYELTLYVRTIVPGPTITPGVYIWMKRAVPSLEFIGYITNDTLVRSVDSSLTFNEGMDRWVLHVMAEEGCGLDGVVMQVHEDVFRPYVYSTDVTMDTLSALPADSVLLYHGPRTVNTPYAWVNDTTVVIYRTEYRNNNCFSVPQEQIFYIGFILEDTDGPRHGFLCLEQLNAMTLKLHYSAIEM